MSHQWRLSFSYTDKRFLNSSTTLKRLLKRLPACGRAVFLIIWSVNRLNFGNIYKLLCLCVVCKVALWAFTNNVRLIFKEACLKVLVTGGLGFIGSSLSMKLLEQGHDVLSIDNLDPYYDPEIKLENQKRLKSHKNFKSLVFDLLESERLDQEFDLWRPDIVFHAAAKAGVRPSLANPSAYIEANISALTSLLEVMRRHELKKIVFCSSSSVYGKRELSPADESEKFSPG